MSNEEIIRKKYEISFITRSEADGLAVKEIIEKNSGQNIELVPAVKTRLAYPIKKENYAFFGVVYFDALPETIEAIGGDLRLRGDILRFLIVTPPVVKGKVEEKKPSPKSRTAAPPSAAPAPAVGSLSNAALEKTLEEILK